MRSAPHRPRTAFYRGISWVTLALSALAATAQEADEEPATLGKPADWTLEVEAAEQVEVADGSALHAEPDASALVITLLPGGWLPLVESEGTWVKVRYGDRLGWVDLESPLPPERSLQARGDVFVELAPKIEPLRLGAGWEQKESGAYALYSQIDDAGLMDYLLRVANDHVRLYSERYGLPLREVGGSLILLADGEAMIGFQRARGHEMFESGINGYFHSPDLVVLFRGFNSRQQLAATVIHELTHLVSWQALHGAGRYPDPLPPWLEEGMAEDLSLASFGRGRLRAEPLGPGNLRYSRRLGGVLWELDQQVAVTGTAPSLPVLLAMDERSFWSGNSGLNYLMSAIWVRYLLSDDELAPGFKAYIASVAKGGNSDPDALLSHLGRTWPQLSNGYRGYLVRERTRLLQ